MATRQADAVVVTERQSTTGKLVPAGQQAASRAQQLWNGTKRLVRKNAALLLMATPALLVLLIYSYIPMYGVVVAFKNFSGFDGILGSPWVGLENFRFLFLTNARQITYNTLFMNALFIISGTVCSLGVALMLNAVRDTGRGLSRIYQAVIFFPYLLSYVIVSYFLYALLDTNTGLLNHLLTALHFSQFANFNWYAMPQLWPAIMTFVFLWKSLGFGTIIYLAGLIAINPEYYDAASIDGANIFQRLRFITLPLIRPLIILQVLLAVGRIFYSDFGLFYIVTRQYANPQLLPTTNVIDTYVYSALIGTNDAGLAAAAGLYQSLVGFVLILLANWLVRRIDPDSAIF